MEAFYRVQNPNFEAPGPAEDQRIHANRSDLWFAGLTIKHVESQVVTD